ncbi:MAG: hypothetical protein KBD63_01455 [Bacteriovoracaceae bacterium]|nr:hypothetical protein [Bacteriovoracaceae bacterium]
MSDWSLEKITLHLNVPWKISRNISLYKENFIVTCRQGELVGRGEVAPNIRYGETPEKIEEEFASFLQQNKEPLSHALKFGLDSARIHLECQQKNISVEDFLGVPKISSVATAYSVPMMEIGELKSYIEKIKRFSLLKIKVSNETARETLKEILKITNQSLIIDPNEAWKDADDLLSFLNEFKKAPIRLVEQPMPASFKAEYLELKKKSPFPIFADESIEDVADFSYLKNAFHGVNIKLMKTGSYAKARDLLLEAKKNNMQTMLGCMVETTLGISSAMHLASLADVCDLDGFLLIKDEPFHLMSEDNGILSYART